MRPVRTTQQATSRNAAVGSHTKIISSPLGRMAKCTSHDEEIHLASSLGQSQSCELSPEASSVHLFVSPGEGWSSGLPPSPACLHSDSSLSFLLQIFAEHLLCATPSPPGGCHPRQRARGGLTYRQAKNTLICTGPFPSPVPNLALVIVSPFS